MRGKGIPYSTAQKWSRITPAYAGKAEANTYHPHYHGITPAYAGKSISHHVPQLVKQDHPRLCGEKELVALICWD